MGEANFDSVFDKISSICSEDVTKLQEMVDTIIEQVSSQTACHDVMIRLVRNMRAANASFGHPVCPNGGPHMNCDFGMWLHKCIQSQTISKSHYRAIWSKLMDIYQTLDSDAKCLWASTFEYALKEKVDDEWWRPRLQALVDDPTTPMSLCFKIEDYFEN